MEKCVNSDCLASFADLNARVKRAEEDLKESREIHGKMQIDIGKHESTIATLMELSHDIKDLRDEMREYQKQADTREQTRTEAYHHMDKRISKLLTWGSIAAALALIITTAIINSSVNKLADKLSAVAPVATPR
jgi:Mg2+ and Co2+ transporter CorA